MNQLQQVLAEVKKAVQGKDQTLLWILMTMLAGGNILLEDIPGVGKTTIALAFSKALGLKYGRMQFNPDVLPSDITGYSVYDKEAGAMIYRPGAVLCNLFLADELNRATSRTQAALLEAMEEGQVTVDGITHALPQPFLVIATQNPTGAAGTQLLPDSQMDRFMVRLTVGYPKPADELTMVQVRQKGVNPLQQVRQVMTGEELAALQRKAANVYLKDELVSYVVHLTGATRSHKQLARGASPRATLAVAAMSRASALLHGREYVVPEDVQLVFTDTVAHRLLLTPEALGAGVTPGQILTELLPKIPAPKP